MLVSQFQDVRRFLGRLDAGQDLAAGLKTVCRENGIVSGWLQATAVLRNPTVSPIRADGAGLDDPVALDGVAFCPAITGNVSLADGAADLRLATACHRPDRPGEPPVTGLLRGGEVVLCEFLLLACDGVALVRDDAAPAGFAPWVQLQPGPIPAPPAPAVSAGRPAAVSAPAPKASAPSKAVPKAAATPAATVAEPPLPPLRQPLDDDESSELNILEMAVGDYVDHPRFGKCRIVHEPHDDKVTIRLDTGKHVDLHLGVMRVMPPRQVGSRKVFQIEVRRRT